MSPDELREFYAAYIDVANKREYDRMGEFAHDPMTVNGEAVSLAEMVAIFRTHTDAVPDLHWVVQDLVVEGDRIAARLIDTGTPEKEWHGLAPTGASVSFVECAFYRLRDGRIEEAWYLMDANAVREQLAA